MGDVISLSWECAVTYSTGKGLIFLNKFNDGMENLLFKSAMTLNWIGWLAIWEIELK